MKIVQFSNGQYAIRKWSWLYLSYVYRDLNHPQFWWTTNSKWIKDCMSTDLVRVESEYNKLINPVNPMKVVKVIR